MPVTVPQIIRKAWGDEVVAEFLPWLDKTLQEVLQEKTVARDEYRQVLSRLDMLDNSVSLISDGLTQARAEFSEQQAQMRAELNGQQAQMRAEFRQELSELRRDMNERFDRMNERFDQTNERFDRMHERFDQTNERFDRMYDRMLVQTRWLIGSLVLFGTVISVLLAIGQFIK